MKILAVNGSPRGKSGNTECILQPFLEGANSAGAQTETIYLNEKHIHHCSGCLSCWSNTPGTCIHNDDMQDLLPKIADADILVYASPLYVFTVTGLMKDFMDRKLPLFTPAIQEKSNRYFHDKRYPKNNEQRSVLISNCGFPGKYNFSGLVETFKVMTGNKLAAAILLTQGGILKNEELSDLFVPYFTAVKNAGRELVEHGSIQPETQAVLDKEILDPAIYQQAANASLASLGK